MSFYSDEYIYIMLGLNLALASASFALNLFVILGRASAKSSVDSPEASKSGGTDVAALQVRQENLDRNSVARLGDTVV